MREIGLYELKIIQMDVLSAVHEFCIEKGIKYSLGCGTMLGCARHGGYIPWDDDIDIYLLREDYNKLIELFPESYKGHYKLLSLERTPSWNRAYAKAYDIRTVFQEKSFFTHELGVNIDIFPIDEVPEESNHWLHYNKYRRLLQHVYELKIMAFRKERTWMKNLFLALTKIVLFFVSSRTLAEWIQRMAVKFNGTGSGLVFENCLGVLQKRPFNKALFQQLIPLKFEDRQFMAFADYDAYLTNGFGDWRKLPPKEKQVTHHAFKAWWKD